jgi:hypothetical protein
MPYTYNPTLEYDESVDAHCRASGLDSFEATLDYSRRLATFRPNRQFGMVPKGWTNLDWENEFEHHGPYILGEFDQDFQRRRSSQIQPRWDWLNATWLTAYPQAAHFYRELLDANPTDFTVTALVEDGMFGEAIQPSVALFAATVWNPGQRTTARFLRRP